MLAAALVLGTAVPAFAAKRPARVAEKKAGDRLNVVALMCSQGLVARTITATAKHS